MGTNLTMRLLHSHERHITLLRNMNLHNPLNQHLRHINHNTVNHTRHNDHLSLNQHQQLTSSRTVISLTRTLSITRSRSRLLTHHLIKRISLHSRRTILRTRTRTVNNSTNINRILTRQLMKFQVLLKIHTTRSLHTSQPYRVRSTRISSPSYQTNTQPKSAQMYTVPISTSHTTPQTEVKTLTKSHLHNPHQQTNHKGPPTKTDQK